MNLSDNEFSSAEHSPDFNMTGSLQMRETAFHPKYDWRLDCGSEPPEEDDIEEGSESSDNGLNKEIADAYAQGYLNGQQAAMVHDDQDDHARNLLAAALNRLKIVDEAKLTQQFWEVILSLFEQAIGHANMDRELMQQRCDEAVASINENIGEACLHIAASDADILQDYDCDIPIMVDPALLPGSVRLTHAAGQILSGTNAMTEEIESRIDPREGGSC